MSDQDRFETSDNAIAIEQRIEELETMIADNELREFSSKAKEVGKLFKLRLSPDDREHLWSRYQECWTTVKARWEESAKELQENAKMMSEELDALDALAQKKLYKDFWQKKREIDSLFKSLEFPRESKKVSSWLGSKSLWESREKLWQRFQDICGEVKAQRERLEEESESSKNYILKLIGDAQWQARSACDAESFTEIRERLNEIAAMLKKDTTLIKPHRDECWDAYRQENDSLREKREKKQYKDYGDLKLDIGIIEDTLGTVVMGAALFVIEFATLDYDAMFEPKGDPYGAKQLIRDAQQKLQSAFLSKDQRDELRQCLSNLWNQAIAEIEARKKAGQQKHEAWRERTRAACDRKQERLNNTEAYRDRLQDQIDKLEDDIENARNEKWAEKARGWLQEKYEKMKDVEQQIEQLKQEIDDINEKLGE